MKNEPKSSLTGEGNPKPNPWLPAATTHVSCGSNDSWYLLKCLRLRVSLLTAKTCSWSTVDPLKCDKASSMQKWCHAELLFIFTFLLCQKRRRADLLLTHFKAREIFMTLERAGRLERWRYTGIANLQERIDWGSDWDLSELHPAAMSHSPRPVLLHIQTSSLECFPQTPSYLSHCCSVRGWSDSTDGLSLTVEAHLLKNGCGDWTVTPIS